MESDRILALKESGVNYDKAVRLFGQKPQLYDRFLTRFPGDPTFGQLNSALEIGNTEEAFAAAHTFKGLAANLGMEHLHMIAGEMVECLRRGQMEEAAGIFPELKEKYERICEIIAGGE